jgi:hypothetical protein
LGFLPNSLTPNSEEEEEAKEESKEEEPEDKCKGTFPDAEYPQPPNLEENIPNKNKSCHQRISGTVPTAETHPVFSCSGKKSWKGLSTSCILK